jgi:hypothetical protein
MKTLFRMKEATNVQEAITSILDVIEENPVWLNKCTSDLFIIVKQFYKLNLYAHIPKDEDLEEWYCPSEEFHRFNIFQTLSEKQIIKLFQEIKTEYYKFQDNNY